MSESLDNLNKQCGNSKCKKELQGPVTYCPFCGTPTDSESKSVPQEQPTNTEQTLQVESKPPTEADFPGSREPSRETNDGGDTPAISTGIVTSLRPEPGLWQRILKLPLLIKFLIGLASLGLLILVFHKQLLELAERVSPTPPVKPVYPPDAQHPPPPQKAVDNNTILPKSVIPPVKPVYPPDAQHPPPPQKAVDNNTILPKSVIPPVKPVYPPVPKSVITPEIIKPPQPKPCPIDEIRVQGAGMLNNGQWSNFPSYINGQLDNNPACASNKDFEVLQNMATPLGQYVTDRNPKTAATKFASLIDRYGELPILVKFKKSFEMATEKSNDCVVSGGEWDPFKWICKN